MRAALLAIAAMVAAPVTAHADNVTCADGTTSEAGRGACSHHGGIAKTRVARDASRQSSRGVRCSDGSWSTQTGRGACSHHGGVADDGPIAIDRDRRTDADRDSDSEHSIIVRCTDGSISIAEGRGACSHHGGIADHHARTTQPQTRDRTRSTTPWFDDARGEATARCRDGSLSYSKHHRGTCSEHGGVREWLD